MDDALRQLDWSLLQAFLAVAEEGSLSAAARRLGASQPTVGRQIKAVEEVLPAPVFSRHARWFDLTEFGKRVLPAARTMQSAANDIRLAAMAEEADVSGTVRITASRMVSFVTLPAILARMRSELPHLQIDMVSTDDSENLLYGASDIALRMYRPTQLDLVTQYLGEISFGCYASKNYIAEHGMPNGVAEALALDLVGYDEDMRLIDGLREFGFPATRETFATRCDDSMVQWELVAQGCGVSIFQRSFAERDDRVVEIPLDIVMPTLPIWLTTSPAARRTPRIRAVWEMLAREMPPLII